MEKRKWSERERRLLDAAARSVTAFRSWGELEQAAERGYVPTLMARKGDPPREVWAVETLVLALGEQGYRVYTGSGK
jgi:hypothetical protein